MRPKSVLGPQQLVEVVRPEVVANVREDRDPHRGLDPKPVPQGQVSVCLSRVEQREEDAGSGHCYSHREVAPLIAALDELLVVVMVVEEEREGERQGEKREQKRCYLARSFFCFLFLFFSLSAGLSPRRSRTGRQCRGPKSSRRGCRPGRKFPPSAWKGWSRSRGDGGEEKKTVSRSAVTTMIS